MIEKIIILGNFEGVLFKYEIFYSVINCLEKIKNVQNLNANKNTCRCYGLFKKVKNSVIFLMNHDIYVADSSLLFQAKSHSFVLDH